MIITGYTTLPLVIFGGNFKNHSTRATEKESSIETSVDKDSHHGGIILTMNSVLTPDVNMFMVGTGTRTEACEFVLDFLEVTSESPRFLKILIVARGVYGL